MTTKSKIALIVVVIAILGGVGYFKYKKSREPKLTIYGTPTIDKTTFSLSYNGMKYDDDITFGQIKKKVINNHSFEATSIAASNKGNTTTANRKIVFTIKDASNKVVFEQTKTI